MQDRNVNQDPATKAQQVITATAPFEAKIKGERFSYKGGDLSIDIVSHGDGEFMLQIFPLHGHSFHPAMHAKIAECINSAINSRVKVEKGGADYKIEFIPMMSSYCVTLVNIHNILWRELFTFIAVDICESFRIGDFFRR